MRRKSASERASEQVWTASARRFRLPWTLLKTWLEKRDLFVQKKNVRVFVGYVTRVAF